MTVAYIVQLDVQPKQVAYFLALLDGVLDAMRHEENFREAILHRDPESPCRFMLYEAWADHEDVLGVQLHRDLASIRRTPNYAAIRPHSVSIGAMYPIDECRR